MGAPSASHADDGASSTATVSGTKVAAKEAEPVTTKDPQIALDDLELLLAPMTMEETETEAKGWYALLRAKEREITVAELDVRRKNREIAQLEKQKTAAADLAKATEEVKAATSDKDKETATQHLAAAQKNLAETVKTASKETAKEDKKAEATTAAMAKQAEAAPPPAAIVDAGTATASAGVVPAASDKAVLQKAAESAAKKSGGAGGAAKVEKVVAATEKEAAAADQIKTLTQSTPAAAATIAPGAATAAVADSSKKAEKLAEKADEATAAKTDVKVQLVDYSTQLMGERTGLTDRLKLVLDKFEAKGGDGKPYRLYIASIGGIKIDVTDRTATLARISGWLSSEEGGLRLARDVGTFLAYIIGAIIVARIVRMILRRVMSGDHVTSQLLRDFIISSSGRVIVAIGFLLALSALEVNLAPLLAVIGAAGFVVAFALQGTLSNFASGLLIMVFKPFDVGDNVEVGGGIKGKVTHVTIFSTYIRTEDGLTKIVPNDNIWKSVIVNETTGVMKAPATAEATAAEAKSEAA
ncbi:MAG TPA: mechanosensitive ion channel domain-containing protein [Roseiarcus sp.]|jgi:small conductance mechanosensitive channel